MSSVVPAVPWTVLVEQPDMAAVSSSESMVFAVPGSPTSIRPRLPARVMMHRSTRASLPRYFLPMVTPPMGRGLPRMNRRTAFGESFQPRGFRLSRSHSARASSSAAYRRSALGLKIFFFHSDHLESSILHLLYHNSAGCKGQRQPLAAALPSDTKASGTAPVVIRDLRAGHGSGASPVRAICQAASTASKLFIFSDNESTLGLVYVIKSPILPCGRVTFLI